MTVQILVHLFPEGVALSDPSLLWEGLLFVKAPGFDFYSAATCSESFQRENSKFGGLLKPSLKRLLLILFTSLVNIFLLILA